ncbi:MAG TPA: hypothetical protein VLA12_13990 [Planctomycetaceae bacterium]|nr:hypothetical protein [Planctomycetaceae bacterium]
MGARHKLNQSYFNRSLLIAGAIGLATQSFGIFIVVLGTMVILNLHSGEIRPQKRGRRR